MFVSHLINVLILSFSPFPRGFASFFGGCRHAADVGAFVYIDGAPILRHNMAPSVHLTNETFAASRRSATTISTIIPSRFVTNLCMIGVELHASKAPSSTYPYTPARSKPGDGFDLQIVGLSPYQPAVRPNPHLATPLKLAALGQRRDRSAALPETNLPIEFGSDWEYSAAGVEPGAGWKTTAAAGGFTAAGNANANWAVGTAEFGFGDGDEETTVANVPAYFFRKEFALAEPATLAASIIFDDGYVMYVNGVEVGRKNMLGNPVAFNQYASSTSADNEADAGIIIASSIVFAGTNVIAISVHNRQADSSDISFDLGLTFAPVGLPGDVVTRGAVWKYLDTGAAPDEDTSSSTSWFETGYTNAEAWASGAAQLGYGDDDEVTVVSYGPSSSSKHITTYFRREVSGYAIASATTGEAMDPECVAEYQLRVLADDGCVVYIDGQDVARLGLPASPAAITPTTLADIMAHSEGEFVLFSVPASVLPTPDSTNSLLASFSVAVEVHQTSTSSSDLAFDLELAPIYCCAVAASSTSHVVVRPPYLQVLTATSVIVRWDSDSSFIPALEHGTSEVAITTTVAAGACQSVKHKIELDGLVPNTKYYYRLVGDVTGAVYTFTTRLSHDDVKNTLLWYLGDAGTADSHQERVRDAFSSVYPGQIPDLMLLGGDNAYPSGTEIQYEFAMFKMYQSFIGQTSVWSCLGNHDARSSSSNTMTGVHFEAFDFPRFGEANRAGAGQASGSEAFYSVDHGSVHVVTLDSEDSDISTGGAMALWLVQDIASAQAAGQNWLIAYWHHPPYTKGSHDSDTESTLVGMRENILPILEAGGVDLVLCGHSHVYERSYFINGHYGHSDTYDAAVHEVQPGTGAAPRVFTKPAGIQAHQGTVYITAGSAGALSTSGSLDHEAMEVSIGVRGSVVAEITETTMDVKFLEDTEVVRDHFQIYKEPDGKPCNEDACGVGYSLKLSDAAAAMLWCKSPTMCTAADDQTTCCDGAPCDSNACSNGYDLKINAASTLFCAAGACSPEQDRDICCDVVPCSAEGVDGCTEVCTAGQGCMLVDYDAPCTSHACGCNFFLKDDLANIECGHIECDAAVDQDSCCTADPTNVGSDCPAYADLRTCSSLDCDLFLGFTQKEVLDAASVKAPAGATLAEIRDFCCDYKTECTTRHGRRMTGKP